MVLKCNMGHGKLETIETIGGIISKDLKSTTFFGKRCLFRNIMDTKYFLMPIVSIVWNIVVMCNFSS